MPSLYETDYHKWAMETAAALREGRLQDIDVRATAEEIEDLGKSERHSLGSAVAQLFLHLLKTKYQPHLAGASWQASIKKQRVKIARITGENPSLRPLLSERAFLKGAYVDAVLDAVIETGLPEATFPATCPFGPDDLKIVETEMRLASSSRSRSKHQAKRRPRE
jgi:hypothetical protein